MKKRLNNKGMTLVELLAAFTITSVIIIVVMTTTMSLKNKAQALSIKKEIINYKNTVIESVQSDIYKYGIKTATISNNQKNLISIKIELTKITQPKTLTIYTANKKDEKSYIEYDETVDTNKTQKVRYYLPYYGDVITNNKYKYSTVRFATSENTNIVTTSASSKTSSPAIIKISIPIYYGEDLNQEINIIAPVNYSICY